MSSTPLISHTSLSPSLLSSNTYIHIFNYTFLHPFIDTLIYTRIKVVMIPSDPAECAMESRIAQEWDILGTPC